jgi:hypothetical protein
MGNFTDAQDIRAVTLCECGREMHKDSAVCIVCWNEKHNAELAAERARAQYAAMMERHARWGAALRAGWTQEELIGLRPNVPTWEQICQREPLVVIQAVGEWVRGA